VAASVVPVSARKLGRVGVVAASAAGVDAEGGKLERGGRKLRAWDSGGAGLENTGSAQADDVGQAVAAHVRNIARAGIMDAPAAGAGAKRPARAWRRCHRPA